VAKKKAEPSASKPKKAPRAAVTKAAKTATAQAADRSTAETSKRAASAPTAGKASWSSDTIGLTAGEVWRVLDERGEQSVAGLKKAVDASDELVLAALGWLAREDKVAFATSGRSISVSLL
jgi:hypothetical protein